MKNIIKLFIISIITVTFPSGLFAQPDPNLDPDVDTPIDGGISLLVAAGLMYGAKKLHDHKKSRRLNATKPGSEE